MIDLNVVRITDRLLESEFHRREQSLSRETLTIREKATFQNALRSSGTMLLVKDLACRELRARTYLAWELLQRSLSDTGVTLDSNLADELFTWVQRVLEVQFQEMVRYIDRTLTPLGLNAGAGPLQDEATALKKEVRTRIDYLVLTLERRVSDSAPSASTNVMHFYGTVGAVQTGSLSSASVAQQMTQADLTAIASALARVADEIGAASDLAADDRAALAEVISEVRDELRKEKPNPLRVRHLAMGIAGGIQTVASLQPAYQAVKMAVLPLGVVLP